MAQDDYQVTITMTQDTVGQLEASGSSLYGLKAVRCQDLQCRPLVWFIKAYSQQTVISWSESYQAYTSYSDIKVGTKIDIGCSSDPITLNQTWNVADGGCGEVVSRGQETAIWISNSTSGPFTCGLSSPWNSVASPICATLLHGNNLNRIAPVKKILLMFAIAPTGTLAPGTMIKQTYGPSILIDLTESTNRQVSYDIDQGWSWGEYTWANQIESGQDLVQPLIEPLPDLRI